MVKPLVGAGADGLYGPNTGTNMRFIKTEFRCEALGHLDHLSLNGPSENQSLHGYDRLSVWTLVLSTNRTNGHRLLNATDVMRTKCILQERLTLPPVVTAVILGYAEYWVRAAARRDEPLVVGQDTPASPYVKVRVVGFAGAGSRFPHMLA